MFDVHQGYPDVCLCPVLGHESHDVTRYAIVVAGEKQRLLDQMLSFPAPHQRQVDAGLSFATGVPSRGFVPSTGTTQGQGQPTAEHTNKVTGCPAQVTRGVSTLRR